MKQTQSGFLFRIGLLSKPANAEAPKTKGQVDLTRASIVVIGLGY